MNKIWVKNLSVNAEWLLGEQIEGHIWTQHALKPYNDYFLTKSVTWFFDKKLPTPGTHYKAIPDPEPTLPESLLPNLADSNREIDTSLITAMAEAKISSNPDQRFTK